MVRLCELHPADELDRQTARNFGRRPNQKIQPLEEQAQLAVAEEAAGVDQAEGRLRPARSAGSIGRRVAGSAESAGAGKSARS
jgi:hypothetical protein